MYQNQMNKKVLSQIELKLFLELLTHLRIVYLVLEVLCLLKTAAPPLKDFLCLLFQIIGKFKVEAIPQVKS